ncbi:helix-turn-helix domain-containing protein [Algoriphagus halophilus]|uniref:Regulatory protein, luxR family n=1 Tax=Algoriphagus halophilus TaxID=226505 RepID=A0A1N6D8M4_9BACT|nr:helix-turn-helix transcriptional regulator [Algoriphagus halophilus]SIN67139.1 regulatory protein, luxR family [Algoriphagus halophilus]
MGGLISDSVMHFWKNEYALQIKKYTKYEPTDQFHQIATMCAPGKSYYYILNLNKYKLDYIHPNVENVVGIKKELATIDSLLNQTLPSELAIIEKKEKIIYEFMQTFDDHRDLLPYKTVYTYRCRALSGKVQTMMVQTTVLTLTDQGKIEHAFVIHSDISHLGNITTDWVSFIHHDAKKSYLNINAEHGRFDPKLANLDKSSCTADLTKRELEIVKLMSEGLSSKAISEKLFISFNTARTHRKNILLKTNSSNTAELMAKCLAEGVI